MWLTGTSLERIDSALGRSQTADVDRLLAEILAGALLHGADANHVRGVSPRPHPEPPQSFSRPDLHVPGGARLVARWRGVATLQRLLEQRVTPDAQSSEASAPMPRASRRVGVLIALLVLSVAGLAATMLTSAPWTGRVTTVPSPMTRP